MTPAKAHLNAVHVEGFSSPIPRIVIGGFTREASDRIADAAHRCAVDLLQRHPHLSLDRLERLVVYSDYREALLLHEAEVRLFNADLVDLASETLAVVVPTDPGMILLVHPDVAIALTGADRNTRLEATRVLTHELCHAHDLGFRGEWLLRSARGLTSNDRRYWRCASMWAEYFANRWSYFDGANVVDDWHRLDQRLRHLHEFSLDRAVKEIAAAFGYALGTLAAMGISLGAVRPDIVDHLHARGLHSAWVQADAEVRKLADTGECWRQEEAVLGLAGAVRLIEQACANACDPFHPHRRNDAAG